MADPNSGDNVLDVLIRFRADLDKAIADSKKGVGQISDEGKKAGGIFESLNAILGKFGLSLSKLTGAGAVAAFAKDIYELTKQQIELEASTARLKSRIEEDGVAFSAYKDALRESRAEALQYGVAYAQWTDAAEKFKDSNLTGVEAFQAATYAAKVAKAENIDYGVAVDKLRQAILFGYTGVRGAMAAALANVREELRNTGSESSRLALILRASGDEMQRVAQSQIATTQGAIEQLGKSISEANRSGFSGLTGGVQSFLTQAAEGMTVFADGVRSLVALGDLKGAQWFGLGDAKKFEAAMLDARIAAINDIILITQRQIEQGRLEESVGQVLLDQQRDKLDVLKKQRAELGSAGALADAEEKARAALQQKAIERAKATLASQQATALDAQAKAIAEVAKIDEAARKNKYDRESVALQDNLDKRLNLIQDYYDGETEIAKVTFAKQADAWTRSIESAIAQASKSSGKQPEDTRAAIVDIAAGNATPQEFVAKWGISDSAIQHMVTTLNAGATAMRSLQKATEDVSQTPHQNFLKAMADQKKALDDVIQSYEQQRKILKAQADSTAMSESQRITLDIRLRKDEIKRALEEIQLQENKLLQGSSLSASVLSPDEAQAVENRIEELRVKVAELTPTLEEVAATSNDVWVGMQLGAKRVSDKIKTFAQMTADSIEIIANRLGDGFYNAFEGIINGSKSAASAFRDMAVSMVQDIGRLFAQQAAFNLVSGLLGGFNLFSNSASNSTLQTTGSFGFKAGQGMAEGGVIPGPVTTDDRFPVMVRGGEGFIRPEAVSWLGGASTIHAINRMQVPAPIVNMLRSLSPIVSSTPRFSFAEGGVVPLTRVSGGDGTVPVVVQNTVAIGDSEIARIAASSESRKGVMSAIAANPRQVRQILGLS